MTEKFHNKFRIASARAQWWDYGLNGAYFITICAQNRECFFGKIEDMQLIASQIGQLAQKHWHEIPEHFRFVKLDDFVLMPNHMHGIIIIDKPDGNGCDGIGLDCNGCDGIGWDCNGCDGIGWDCRDAINRVSTESESQSQPQSQSQSEPIRNKMGGITGNKNPMLHENISRIIRWYKGRCSFDARKIHADFAWQSRFYDHIIRDDDEYQRIAEYIRSNPMNWKSDRFYK